MTEVLSGANPPKKIAILGATGSIGRSALDVVRSYPNRFEVAVLAAHSNDTLLAKQAREFKPAHVVLTDADAAKRFQTHSPDTPLLTGLEGLCEAACFPVDIVLCAVVGAVGLKPLLCAIEAGNPVAVANKEPFVMAGPLVMEAARRHNVAVLPVDSEHNAIFQCLMGHKPSDVRCIHLTASGGPFYGVPRETLANITPEQATKHPTWNMGPKISVDSATLMNKGLEIIEAMGLFELPEDKIEVVIHPQSVIHSMVEFNDGNILAHLGVTDMKFPILFALTHPERVEFPMERLDLTSLQALTFAAPDFSEFPCLAYARQAAKTGGTAPTILNAANELAVAAFCKRRIPFLAISEVVRKVLETCSVCNATDLETIWAADAQARRQAAEIINQTGS